MNNKYTSWIVISFIVGAVVFSAIYGFVNMGSSGLASHIVAILKKSYNILEGRYLVNTYLFYFLLAGVFILEYLFPAKKNQKIFSVGMFQDIVWFLSYPVFIIFIVKHYRDYFSTVYENYLQFLTVELITQLPLPIQVITAILVSDFLHWLRHILQHKVRVFWCFHTVHHSQQELNLFTDRRIHPVEVLITYTVRFLPFMMLEVRAGLPSALAWIVFSSWYTMLYHGNIKTNFGLLKYVLVTPQSHRIHHSLEKKHQDKNFGVIFTFWDHLFGTQYKNYDEYPETGIHDERFPIEKTVKGISLVATIIRQLIYPFQLILRNPTANTTAIRGKKSFLANWLIR